ncbi:MAG: prephenate dehydrogenase [Clostridia bacterium]|nr:prephenate dehydrogenase [Clostridia bacterium]
MTEIKNIAIIGLGLIGGSMAKAITAHTDCHIMARNRTRATLLQAIADGAVHEELTDDNIGQADMIILGLYPEEAVEYMEEIGNRVKKGALVIDVSGIKRYICRHMPPIAEKYGFVFVGAHPMAGKEKSGYANSEAALFKGASFIITPTGDSSSEQVEWLKGFAAQIGFGMQVVCSPEEHDRMIAFTSQLPHVLANAYVQSPQCLHHRGFSAGSYRDVSRVARLNEHLWAELFLQNADALTQELDLLIKNITEMCDAIKAGDRETLETILGRGRMVKEELGE